ncbi:MAG: hypothetical protein VXV96_16775 [Bdellovibrionota bacterium]|nr:hypothetical protein [Bdellovibrionota bacterium]
MRLLIAACALVVSYFYGTQYADRFYFWIKKEALTKAAQGLPSMTSITVKLTGKTTLLIL